MTDVSVTRADGEVRAETLRDTPPTRWRAA